MFEGMSFAHLTTWVVNILFCVALIPQLWVDYKIRSTKGISDTTLFFLYMGYAWNVVNVFCLALPIAYRIWVPVALLCALGIVFQRFYFNSPAYSPRLVSLYVLHTLIWFTALPIAFLYPAYVGWITGWSIFCIWILFQIPQILKLYRSRDVEGFSPFFPAFLLIGMGLELTSGLMLKFPLPTILNSTRAVIGYTIMLLLYFRNVRRKP